MCPMIGESIGSMLGSSAVTRRRTRIEQEVPDMSPVTNISPVKTAFAIAALLCAVAAGLVIRGATSVDVPLGAMDDFAIRHAADTETSLTLADDYGTRNQAPASELTLADDFGTRNQRAPMKLTTADDFGTRNSTPASKLGANDDYATRESR
jgi:hypothetical protein